MDDEAERGTLSKECGGNPTAYKVFDCAENSGRGHTFVSEADLEDDEFAGPTASRNDDFLYWWFILEE